MLDSERRIEEYKALLNEAVTVSASDCCLEIECIGILNEILMEEGEFDGIRVGDTVIRGWNINVIKLE